MTAVSVVKLNVMIGGPSDTQEFHRVAVDSLMQWNSINCDDFGIYLHPVHWSTDAQSALGMPAQAVINHDVVAASVALIAVFSERLGSPTEHHASGSTEEIELFADADRHVMLYFSDHAVARHKATDPQFLALSEYRDAMKKRDLVTFFDGKDDFRAKVSQHITLLAQRLRSSPLWR